MFLLLAFAKDKEAYSVFKKKPFEFWAKNEDLSAAVHLLSGCFCSFFLRHLWQSYGNRWFISFSIPLMPNIGF